MSGAEFVGDVNRAHFVDQKLWKVGTHYVVTSSVTGRHPTTRVVAADTAGHIASWVGLAGTLYARADHDKAIAGYVDSLDEAAS